MDVYMHVCMQLTSLLPLPNPLITGPESRIGNGGSGPVLGPATGSRGPEGRILSLFGESRGSVCFCCCVEGVGGG